MKEQGLHTGHRDRTIKKFLQSADSFSDHEVLEVLLYYAIPRVDTNPLAHKLLKMFGSLDGVFSATASQLKTVDGVGEKTATYILAIGQVVNRIKAIEKKKVKFKNTFDVKEWLFNFFENKEQETFVMLMLDDKYNLMGHCVFSDNKRSTVKAEMPEVVMAFNVYKPKYALFSHNHPSKDVEPSKMDDFTTKKLNVLCELNDVNMLDHIIVAGKEAYSYRQSGKLDHIKQTINLNNIFTSIDE